jgi:hypothetical protein
LIRGYQIAVSIAGQKYPHNGTDSGFGFILASQAGRTQSFRQLQ